MKLVLDKRGGGKPKKGITNKYYKFLNLFKRAFRVKKCSHLYTCAYIHIHAHSEICEVLMACAHNLLLKRKEKTKI